MLCCIVLVSVLYISWCCVMCGLFVNVDDMIVIVKWLLVVVLVWFVCCVLLLCMVSDSGVSDVVRCVLISVMCLLVEVWRKVLVMLFVF